MNLKIAILYFMMTLWRLVPAQAQWFTQQQWALKNSGEIISNQKKEEFITGTPGVDINIQEAWRLTHGSSQVIVAIIDTGIDFNQEELKHALWKNEKEFLGLPGIDDDHNGYIDDIYGLNLANPKVLYPNDRNGHGTHVASLIAANGDNQFGITGVSWGVKIMPIKYLDDQMYALTENAAPAIRYAVDMGAHIINCSWGSALPSDSLKEAILYARSKNVLLIAGAGNEASNLDLYQPSNPESEGFFPALYNHFENVISVAAIDPRGELTAISNYGKNTVDLAAPGWGVLGWTIQGLQLYQGTSQATPFVTGAAALIKSQFPNLSVKEIKTRLLSSTTPHRFLRKKIKSGGFLNVSAALLNQKPPPDALDPFFWKKQNWTWQSEHPYKRNQMLTTTLTIPKAKFLALHYSKLSIYSDDRILVTDSAGKTFSLYGNLKDDYTTHFQGPTIKIHFQPRSQQEFWGFDFDHVAFK